MNKKILFIAFSFFSIIAFAQEGTTSPYSFYGIGEVRFKGTQDIRAMGGVGVMQDSIHINLENPASYAGLKQTLFTIGASYNATQMKNNTQSESAKRMAFDYLAVGLPLGKFGVAFGLMPYSSVGFKIDETAINNKKFDGKGGLNKVFAGVGYQINAKLSIGANMNYHFGTIEIDKVNGFNNVSNKTYENSISNLSGLNFNLGTMFETKLDKKKTLYSALSLNFGNTINANNSTSKFTDIEGFDANPKEASVALTMPTQITIGLGVGESKKWMAGTQFSYRDAGSLTNTYNDNGKAGYGSYAKCSLGGFYIPDYNSFTSYAKRIVYRGGLKYEKTGLYVLGQPINDYGLTLGIGLPITQSFSNFNIGFEIGQRGTTNAGLIKENYANISMSFSLNDKWFVKRRFN
jgi:hypothetical protein